MRYCILKFNILCIVGSKVRKSLYKVINYVAPIWLYGRNRMQLWIYRCLLMSPIEHLSVKQHHALLSKQFLLGCFVKSHSCSCSHMLVAEPPPWNIKRTLLQYFNEVQHFTDQASDAANFRQLLNAIHKGAINTFIYHPCTQIRSVYCRCLNSLSRIDPNIPNLCPACNEFPHDSNQLFACPLNPTHLTLLHLWYNPVETSRFQDLPLSDFNDN